MVNGSFPQKWKYLSASIKPYLNQDKNALYWEATKCPLLSIVNYLSFSDYGKLSPEETMIYFSIIALEEIMMNFSRLTETSVHCSPQVSIPSRNGCNADDSCSNQYVGFQSKLWYS
jgi:hypothetical protein